MYKYKLELNDETVRYMSRHYQKKEMSRLCKSLPKPKRNHFRLANIIANARVSENHQLPYTSKKEMPSDLVIERDKVLPKAVDVVVTLNRFALL